MKKLQVLFLFSTIGLSQSLWTQSEGVAIRQGVHIEWQRTVCPGANGDVIVLWSDTRNGNRDIYSQKIAYDGTMIWGNDGKPVTNLPGRQEDPVAIEDGAGGAFVAWVDYRLDIAGDIFIQHIDSNGDILLDPNSVALCQFPGTQISINMCTDGNGGVFVTWQDKRNGVNDDIYGTHISSDHVIINPGDGYPIAAINGNQTRKSIEYAGNGEALLVWTDTRESGNSEIYGQRFGTDLAPIFDEGGINISNALNLDVGPRTTFMHGDTNFVVWQNGDESATVLYNLITSSGVVFETHRILSDNDAIKSGPRVKNDVLGNIFIVWKDLRSDPVNGDQYTQKIDFNGDIAWDSSGIRLDNSELLNQNVRFVADDLGGAWYFWENGIFPNVDIVGSNISTNGIVNEYFITQQSGYQFAPIAEKDNSNGAFIIFADQDDGSISLRTQHLNNEVLIFADNGILVKKGLDGDVKFVASDNNSNGIILSWEDTRSERNAYASWITPLGDMLDYNGKHTTFYDIDIKEETNPIPQVLLTDDSFYSLSYSTETGASLIKINRLNSNLENSWDSTGINIYESSGDQISPILFDTPNGLGCIWSDFTNFIDYDIYYQIINDNGEPTLQAPGVFIANTIYKDDYAVAVYPTHDGNLIVILYEQATQNEKYKAKKIDYNGNVITEWQGGEITIAGPYFRPQNMVTEVIDSVGILLAWNEDNNFGLDIKVQILKWDGTTVWPQGGIYATTHANDQANVSMDITPDNATALIVWEDFQNGVDYNISGQLVDIQNEVLLGENILFTTDTSYQYIPKVKNLNNDQFLLVWEDERGRWNPDPTKSIGADLYQTWYSISNNSFELDGIPLVQQYHKQKDIQFAELSSTELLVYWVDLRSSGKEDFSSLYGKLYIKAELLSTIDSSTPQDYSISDAYPNPFNSTTIIEYSIYQIEPVEIVITNLLGQRVYEAVMFPSQPGRYSFAWHGTDIMNRPVASGIYFYQLKVNNAIKAGKLTYLK